ncbi:MAG TPA: hypothetical protein VLT33_46525 [Labilithrix sp.]|nr:hypothetical protein [Labilithrix sp.]
MGVDTTDVLLRVRDEAALREELAAPDDPERQLLVRFLADGNVSVFTGHRFDDADADFTIRCWLWAQFGVALADIHDDPRGVFVYPGDSRPDASTYEGIVEELASVGRFVDPARPTDEERAERERAIAELIQEARHSQRIPVETVASEPPLEGFSSVLSRLVGRDLTPELTAVVERVTSGSDRPREERSDLRDSGADD